MSIDFWKEIPTKTIEEEIYKENILDHYKNPQNHHEMKNATCTKTGSNPLCGDKIKVFLKIDKKRVTDLSFVGEGCAISKAAASMLTEEIKGKTITEIKRITKEDIEKMLGIHVGIVRLKCATLALKTIQEALE